MKTEINELLLGRAELMGSINSMWIKLKTHEIKTGKENAEQRENLKLLESVYKKYATLCGTAIIAQSQYLGAMETVLAQTEIIEDLKAKIRVAEEMEDF